MRARFLVLAGSLVLAVALAGCGTADEASYDGSRDDACPGEDTGAPVPDRGGGCPVLEDDTPTPGQDEGAV